MTPRFCRFRVRWATILLSLLLGAQAFAQGKPVRLVVPFGAGGAPDVIARLMAPPISENLGAPVVVDNRPGATGIIAAEYVKGSPPDGTTLFVADSAHFAINPALRANLPYDPHKDFVPVIEVASSMIYIAVLTQSEAKNVQELVALAKRRPQGLTFGSSGSGTPHHLSMELLKYESGANFIHVPFKGVQQSVPALLSGDVDIVVAGPASLLPHVRAGKVRMIAAVNPMRWSRMPEVPTIAESGFAQYGLDITIGLLAPAGTPPDTVRRLNEGIAKALRSPELANKASEIGLEMIAGTPDQLAQSMLRQREQYARVVKVSGAKAD
jgi:tripartite-type tricarboxylate transporter receptor subunit TctC